MTQDTSDFPALLDCLADRLPALRMALLAEDGLEKKELRQGDFLLKKGEQAGALYVIVSGRLRATITRDDGSELTLSDFGSGEIAGEMAILAGSGIYSATVYAIEDSVIVRVPRESFERISRANPQLAREMAAGIRRRLGRDELAEGLSRLLGPLDDAMLRYVESRVEWVRLHAGKTLFSEGDKAEDLYFVLGGRLRAMTRDGHILNEMTRGESIGEIALLTGEPRTATVTAVRDSELVRVSRQAFDEIVAKYPQVMRAIAAIVVRRLRAKERSGRADVSSKCIAVLPHGDAMSPAVFCERLVRALEKVGTTLYLSALRIDALLARPGIATIDEEDAAGIRLTTWLDEQESHYRFIVYEADAGNTAWTRRCLRQADEILLVADANADPAPSMLERDLLEPGGGITRARRTLILLHADGARLPSGTSRWLHTRDVQRNFHVRLNDEGDYQRVARCLGDAAIGLVLGGGGARGLAHIGVIRALHEAGVPIDVIGGTSIGSAMAGLVGQGQGWEEMLEINRDAWLRHKPHKEYSIPYISLIRGHKLERIGRKTYGDTEIEDLWLSFYCVSCNLSTSEMVVHERGPLWKAIRASSSLPGVFAPVLSDGNILVDGSIVNNLPGDIMRKRSCRTVIVVDVGSAREFTFKLHEFPSPWRILRSKIFRGVEQIKVPHIADVLMRSADVGSNHKTLEVRRDADLCLRPPVDGYSVLQFDALEELTEAGYRYAKQRLSELRGEPRFADLFSN